jgi:HK97 family phage portal protein
MSVADLVPGAYWAAIGLTPEQGRAFATGPGAFDLGAATWGVDTMTFSPPDYGEYLATSNAVHACATLRARLLAQLPLRLYRLTGGDEGKNEVTRGALWQLLQKVNPYWTLPRLVQMTELSLCAWGKAFWFTDERRSPNAPPPRELWWARPDRVKVVPHPQNYVSHFLYEPVNGSEPVRFEPWETVWLRYPNPLEEYEGLSPLAAARIAADVASAAMKSNRNIFTNGMQAAGFVTNGDNRVPFSKQQAEELAEHLDRRFKGVDKAHRVGILHFDAKFQSVAMTPKDAEFLGALKWSLEDVCRAYGVPLDLIGGQRTFENVNASETIVWNHTILPEAAFVATELTEQLLPMFAGGRDGADLCEFDHAAVEVLKEDEAAKWEVWRSQIEVGVRTRNEWRDQEGLPPLAWGEDFWVASTLTPIGGPMQEEADAKAEAMAEQIAAGQQQPPALPSGEERSIRLVRLAYGDPEHERAWQRFVAQTTPHEQAIERTVRDLFRRQERSVLDTLTARSARSPEGAALEPFDRGKWVKEFRLAIRPLLAAAVADAGTAALAEVAVGIAFDVSDPNVVRFLERQAQRFAVAVNETTWDRLKAELVEGIAAGEGTDALAARVRQVMGVRLSDAERIARTETTGAFNGGTIESWRQSGVVKGKTWLSALDDRVRETHIAAHGQTVGLDEDFAVGDATGPGPGLMSTAAETVNCRCSLVAVLDAEAG